jgi:hypothetical protein
MMYFKICSSTGHRRTGAMLERFMDLKQNPGERFRKCFYDDYFDLFIWFEDNGAIHGFQLYYNLTNDEHSLEWNKDSGFRHNRVDNGESPVMVKKRTPIVLPNGPFPYRIVISEFLNRIDNTKKEDIRALFFVYDKMVEYTNSGGKLSG